MSANLLCPMESDHRHEQKVGGRQEITKEMAAEAHATLQSLTYDFKTSGKQLQMLNDSGHIEADLAARLQKLADVSDKQIKDGRDAAKMYGKPGMPADAEQRLVELLQMISTIIQDNAKVKDMLLMGKAKSPSKDVPNKGYLDIVVANLMKNMSSLHEKIELAKTIATRCRSSSSKG